jgi:hypothetical protein
MFYEFTTYKKSGPIRKRSLRVYSQCIPQSRMQSFAFYFTCNALIIRVIHLCPSCNTLEMGSFIGEKFNNKLEWDDLELISNSNSDTTRMESFTHNKFHLQYPQVNILSYKLSLVANEKSLQQSHNTSIPSSHFFFKLSQICVQYKVISFLKYLTHNRGFLTQNKIFQKKNYHNRKAKRILPNMLSTFSRSKLHNQLQRNSQSK